MFYSTPSSVSSNDTYLWHLRMGDLNVTDIKKLPNCIDGVTLTVSKGNDFSCSRCFEGKHARLPFKNACSRAVRPLELMHSDLCGPMENLSY